jgi:hypothetical protein
MFMRVWDDRAFEIRPGEEPRAVLDPDYTPGIQSYGSFLRLHLRSGTLHHMVDVFWGVAIVQVGALQLIAAAIAGGVALVIRRRRSRSLRQGLGLSNQ